MKQFIEPLDKERKEKKRKEKKRKEKKRKEKKIKVCICVFAKYHIRLLWVL